MRIFGILGPIIALAGVVFAYLLNRDWWSITENAISDLGRVGLPNNWVMNCGLIIGGLLLLGYGAWRLKKSKNPGWAIYVVGSVFLVLIGVFPEGTEWHYEVSWGFFVSMFAAMLIISISILKKSRLGFLGLAVFCVSLPLALFSLKAFSGVAVAETVSILAFLIFQTLTLVVEDV
ncbi:DUF998 domain-containing protein [Pyrococcus abyssi]|uniref:Predicted membrane protein n=1 Tax=Pyrococcus abyssi (strain GE5 / Orsay) TaxID=272844 RepID=Q9V235_PYRAB|nr:DUF998 domain-containing protein [Pyrococcus abyssi]CAB49163.1 Predicted membrane protein [Pyrococcus abyssi GE5]CCE69615.1 TPA: hypothetical protein PAB0162 [Pyrococcus abyssi GE5]